MKEIRKDSFVYRVAYGIDAYPPEKTSLCGMFWKFIFMLFAWPLLVIAATSIGIVFYAVGFLVAAKPNFSDGGIDYYEKWPEIRGHRIWPITVLAIITALGLIYEIIFSSAAKTAVAFGASHPILIISGLAVIGVIITVFANQQLKEIMELAMSYLRAKKEKVCPMIKFVGAESKEEK